MVSLNALRTVGERRFLRGRCGKSCGGTTGAPTHTFQTHTHSHSFVSHPKLSFHARALRHRDQSSLLDKMTVSTRERVVVRTFRSLWLGSRRRRRHGGIRLGDDRVSSSTLHRHRRRLRRHRRRHAHHRARGSLSGRSSSCVARSRSEIALFVPGVLTFETY